MLHAILARDPNGVIGYEGKLPWHIPQEMALFHKLRRDYDVLVMGYRTYHSLPASLLDNQRYYVITNEGSVQFMFDNFKNARLLVIGGASTIKKLLPDISCFHLSEVKATYVGDTHFTDKLEGFMPIETLEYDQFIYKQLVKVRPS